jgi:hypothetical protein
MHSHKLKNSERYNDVLQLKTEPLKTVRIGFIGLGKRGKQSFNHYMYIEGVEVMAICDMNDENLEEVNRILSLNKKVPAQNYNQFEDWKTICERSDIDLIYICTDRKLHTSIAVYAMECGKHTAVEVPAANSLEECWQLVDTAEKTRKHCIMLENCCYDQATLSILNMKQQGLFGEVFHTEGAYIHDLKHLDFEQKKHYTALWQMQGNPYPTHGLGPLCQLFDIHRGDRLKSIVSVSSGQFNVPDYIANSQNSHCKLGNINTSIIKTEKDKTIVLQHDISSPRPYSLNFLLSGTKGFVQNKSKLEIAFSDNPTEYIGPEVQSKLLKKYQHRFYAAKGELAREVGAHGGMDFIMDYRLIYCLQNGLALDMDVYDAAEWSSIVALSAESVNNGSKPVEIPDFTRGKWSKINGLSFSE